MKLYIKNNIKKNANQIVIIKNGYQIINPTEKMIIEDGWNEYVPSEMNTINNEQFDIAKQKFIGKLFEYDNSSEINLCYINYLGLNLQYWADKNERSILKTAVQDCIALGRDTYRLDLRDLNVSININCERLLQMLAALEVYAIDCYNTTTDHLYAIKALTTQKELDVYDYKLNYPEKLKFDI